MNETPIMYGLPVEITSEMTVVKGALISTAGKAERFIVCLDVMSDVRKGTPLITFKRTPFSPATQSHTGKPPPRKGMMYTVHENS